MAAGSVWKGLVGLGLFALAHAAFSAAQREWAGGGPGWRRRLKGVVERGGPAGAVTAAGGAPGAGAGPRRHHRHQPWGGLALAGRERSGRSGGSARDGRADEAAGSRVRSPPAPSAPPFPGCPGRSGRGCGSGARAARPARP